MTPKAIETEYAGHRFRSRLEARWAVLFDQMGWAWEYEPQGFELSSGERYLPDFWLPGLRMHAEVKPGPPVYGTTVYLAGNMDSNWRSEWKSICRCNNPVQHHDHIGSESGRVVLEKSLRAIRESDVVIAVLDRPEMYGTVAEIGYARGIGKDVAVLITKSAIDRGSTTGHGVYDFPATHMGAAALESKVDFGEYWFCCEMAWAKVISDAAAAVEDIKPGLGIKILEDEVKPQTLSVDSSYPVMMLRNIPYKNDAAVASVYRNGAKTLLWPEDVPRSHVFWHACDNARKARFEHGQTPDRSMLEVL